MGLLQAMFGRQDPPQATAPPSSRRRRRDRRRASPVRGRVEVLEPRQMLSGDGIAPEVLLGGVYFEEATGDDSQPDVIDITFSGGAAGTTLDRLVISGDKRGDGRTDGDIFFDIAEGGAGAFQSVGLSIVESNGFTVTSVTVVDGGSEIVFTFDGFDAGETLRFSVDVDELQFVDPAGDSVNSLVEGAEFERSTLVGDFSANGYVDLALTGRFWDAFDGRRDTAEGNTGVSLALPDDTYSEQQDFRDRTAGAVAHAPQVPLATLSGWVYHDRSDDGLFNRGTEEGIGGVTLELLDGDGNGTGITTTTSTEPGLVGFYEFRNLTAGTYGVREVQPTGWIDGQDTPGSHGGTAADESGGRVDIITGVALGFGDNGVEYNFGELLVGSIAGRVHATTGPECGFDDPEIPLAGVRVDLLDSDGNLLESTTTNDAGEYRFDGLAPGEYQIREHQPENYFDGDEQIGTAGGVASDPSDQFSLIAGIELGSGVDAVRYDFCEYVGPSLSGWVYHDRSNEGTFNRSSEEGIGGVVVELLDENGVPTGVTTVTSTAEGSVGYYEFTNLAPGTYGVRELQPAGWIDGIDTPGTRGGTAASESNGRVDRITGATLRFGDAAQEYNFGELRAASIAGRVHASTDGDCGFDDPEILLEGVQVDLLDELGNTIATTFTNAEGEYSFNNLVPGTYQIREHQPDGYFDGDERLGTAGGELVGNDQIGGIQLASGQDAVNYDFCEYVGVSLSGWVYHDRSNDGSFDRSGPNGTREEGIAQVTLRLLDGNGNDTGRRAVTNSEGYYEFANLAAGEYAVMEVQPDGWLDGIDTPGNLGGVADSALRGDMISEIMIAFGQSGTNYNFGELQPGSIRGRVHIATDGDCDPDLDEPPIAEVVIDLLNEQGEVIATTKTDANGEYAFEDLAPGNYSIREQQPTGFFDGGLQVGSGGGSFLGEDVIGDIPVGSGQDLVNYDFCEVPPARISGYVFIDGAPILVAGSLPDDLSLLRNGQRTPDDTPLAGVTIELRHGISGDPILGSEALPGAYSDGPIRTVTDANGFYEFANLPGGNYSIVEIQPEGLIDGIDTQGTLGGLVVNLPGSANDPILRQTGGVTELEQQAINDMRARFGNDVIFRVVVRASEQSEENNFSEISRTTIFIPPTDDPIEETPVFSRSNPFVPQFLFPLVANPSPSPLIFGGSSKVIGYTWHLSLVDAGQPRSTPLSEEAAMLLTAQTIDAAAWQPTDIDQAMWRLGEDSSSDGEATERILFGNAGAIPVVGDWDGDGDDEIAVFINGRWYFDLNGNGHWDSGDMVANLGSHNDLPTTGDWDGDGKTDIAIFGPAWAGDPWAIRHEPGLPDMQNNPGPIAGKAKNVPPTEEEATLGARTLQRTSRGEQRTDLIDHVFHYGVPGDQPVTGDWNGDGIATIGLYRAGVWHLDLDGDGRFTDADVAAEFGTDFDSKGVPVVGDWNGDGIDDLGLFVAGSWQIDSNGDRQLDAVDRVFEMGKEGDLPVAGDWNGDGRDQPGVYTPVESGTQETPAA